MVFKVCNILRRISNCSDKILKEIGCERKQFELGIRLCQQHLLEGFFDAAFVIARLLISIYFTYYCQNSTALCEPIPFRKLRCDTKLFLFKKNISHTMGMCT